MRNRSFLFSVLTASLTVLLMANVSVSDKAISSRQMFIPQYSVSADWNPVNTDGDLSLRPEENRVFWNPHSVGLTSASDWSISFTTEAEMYLKTTSTEVGHIATGAWWTNSFKSKAKLQLYASEPSNIVVGFRINVLRAELNSGSEWLRIALACAIQRAGGSILYAEMDLWDSPSALAHASGNIRLGGNVVYRGADVVEYKVDQMTTGQWRSYVLNLTQCINDSWQLNQGDLLESVYFVVEAAGAVTVAVRADDLLIARLD
jgi:hypothetical protein